MKHIKRFSPFILAMASLGPLDAYASEEQGVAEDPVMASFQRMLSHDSSHIASPVPSSSGEDPLRAAVNGVLWQSEPASFHLADGRCRSVISNMPAPESTQTSYRKDETCPI